MMLYAVGPEAGERGEQVRLKIASFGVHCPCQILRQKYFCIVGYGITLVPCRLPSADTSHTFARKREQSESATRGKIHQQQSQGMLWRKRTTFCDVPENVTMGNRNEFHQKDGKNMRER